MQNDAERNAGDAEEEWTDEEVEEYISLDIHDPELLANPHIFEGMVVHVRPLDLCERTLRAKDLVYWGRLLPKIYFILLHYVEFGHNSSSSHHSRFTL